MSLICIAFFVINCLIWDTQAVNYNIEFLETESNVTTPHNCDMSLNVARISRGAYGLSGFIDFKEDINTDKATGYCKVYYSSNGLNYQLAPYRILPTTLTEGINFLYKNYMMDAARSCCKNALYFEGNFVAPLTKRVIECDKCLIKTHNFPTHLPSGFYKVLIAVSGEIGFAVTTIHKVESD